MCLKKEPYNNKLGRSALYNEKYGLWDFKQNFDLYIWC